MIKVSVLYPNREGAKFDIAYYCNRHIPLVQRLLGSALKGASVDHGISGEGPGTPAPYLAMGHLLFDSVQDFQKSFGPQCAGNPRRHSKVHEFRARSANQ
jgi:uncharacterized protein (TIGR02118 family)